MIKLFYAPGTCALAPHIVLEWIGEPYDLQKVKPSDPDYLQLNPLGQVPALIDGDSGVMNQADALLKYLAHKYPDAKLGDDGTLQDVYELDRWLAFLTGDVHPAFFPFFAPQRYAIDERKETQQAVKEKSYKLIDRVFKHLDAYLDGKEHLVGNRRTIADAYAFAMIRWGNALPDRLADYPNLSRFYQILREDEGVQRTMTQQGIDQ
ncbi:glutathione S-transferase family protein [Microcoleus sp. FACHB-1515]|uniref:glutathione S-transferase family protein n=1 Tax=Cyanophyceae TaxID=3028117 RepID=UPI001685DE70|nr:glutathione binding-like protein [Microcoleus sp. FACHB-1515]MBD2090653.1 glutathione S-transferase family protein [Microcoleus sp. FACHB-1515]